MHPCFWVGIVFHIDFNYGVQVRTYSVGVSSHHAAPPTQIFVAINQWWVPVGGEPSGLRIFFGVAPSFFSCLKSFKRIL